MLSAENSLKVRLSVATRDVPPSSVGLSGARPSGAPRSSRLASTVWRSSSCSSPLIGPLLRRSQIDTPPRRPKTDGRLLVRADMSLGQYFELALLGCGLQLAYTLVSDQVVKRLIVPVERWHEAPDDQQSAIDAWGPPLRCLWRSCDAASRV